jgi:hypothetical protein
MILCQSLEIAAFFYIALMFRFDLF